MAKTFLTSIDLAGNELMNASIHNLATAPASPKVGQIYFNTGSKIPMFWNGTAWTMFGHTTSQINTIVRDTTLTGYTVGANSALAATDTVLGAFRKVQGQIDAIPRGTVTSVGLSVPEGLSVSSSPITGSGTITISLASGYSIPKTSKQTEWDTAYSQRHAHGNKSIIDALTQGHIDVLNLLSVVDGNIKVDTTLWATGGISALGLGEDGSGSGGGVDMLDGWGNYTEAKADYYVPASLLVPFRSDTLDRLSSLESGSATSISITGTGNAITSITKSGTAIIATKGSTFSLSTHNHDTLYKPIGYAPTWGEVTGKPSTFAPSAHTHTKSQITDFPTTWAWGDLTGVPSTFAPSSHSHSWSQITSKPTTFAPSAHTLDSHSNVTITSIASGEILKWDGTKWVNNTLAEAGISASSHSHSWSQITNKPSTFAPSAHTHTIANVTGLQTAIDSGVADAKTYADDKFALAIPLTQKGAAGGVAELDAEGIILSSQLPSYVDDVLEFSTLADFPTTGESGKIYVATNTNLTYRWSGTAYVEISKSLALGTSSSTAYRGDHGLIAYNHSQTAHVGKKTGTIGTGLTTVVTHGLGSANVVASVMTTAGEVVECDIINTATTTTFRFNVAPAASTYKYVIIG